MAVRALLTVFTQLPHDMPLIFTTMLFLLLIVVVDSFFRLSLVAFSVSFFDRYRVSRLPDDCLMHRPFRIYFVSINQS